MNSIVVDGINQTTNDDLLVVARPSNVEVGTNFKLSPQTFIKFLRNNTISSNSFFPINLNNRFINVQEGQTVGNSTIDLRETESLTIDNYGLITGKTDRTNIGRDFYQISGTINAVLEQGRSYFDSNNSYRSPTLGNGYACFVRDSNGTQNDNWSALFDKNYADFVYSEVTITQGQCDSSNEPGIQSTTKLYIYWGNSTNTTAGAVGQINARTKVKNWMTPLSRINVNDAGEYDQKSVFAYNLGENETPLFEIDTLNRKIKKLPITPYNYNANSAQLGLSVTIESF